jgi:hypothetical protein
MAASLCSFPGSVLSQQRSLLGAYSLDAGSQNRSAH